MFNETLDESPSPMRTVLRVLTKISTPYFIVISMVGIIGNSLTILMLVRRSLSQNFNNCTLIALALTDLLFNFTLVSRCVNDQIQSNGKFLCPLIGFLSHYAEFLSACFTAQFTAQRFIAVRFPLRVFIEKKIHLLHYVIVSFFIVFGISFCLALVLKNSYDDCHEEMSLNWFISDAILSFLIPFTTIATLNFLIIFHLKRGVSTHKPFRFRLTAQNDSPFRGQIYENIAIESLRNPKLDNATDDDVTLRIERTKSFDLFDHSASLRSKSQSYRVTRMLIIVSTCFLLLNAPSHICAIGLKFYTIQETMIPMENSTSIFSVETTRMSNEHFPWLELVYLLMVITQHISFASYSINFFLYSFCGMKFRRELIRCVSKSSRQTAISRSLTAQNTL